MSRGRRLERIVGARLAAQVSAGDRRRLRLRRGAFALALALGVLASCLGPHGRVDAQVDWQGIDAVLCLDVSRSMLARDIEPARLLRAQQDIAALGKRAGGDRLALVLFAGDATLAVPLTRDGPSLAGLAALADPTSVRSGGTDLGAALEAGLAALNHRAQGQGAIVLLTDGEDLGAGGRAAAVRCRAAGVAVHAVGYGTLRGSKIALGGEGGPAFLVDRTGRDVVSALDASGLEALTDATGGTFVAAEAGALVRLYEERIVPTARARHAAEQAGEGGRVFQWLLLASLLLWLLELWWTDRSRR